MEWAKEANDKRWVNIENFTSITQLSHVIWNPPQFRTLGPNTHVITHNAFKIWDQIHLQNKWEFNSPLIYLKDNEFFSPGMGSVGGNWIKKGNAQLKDIIKKGKINTYNG